MTTAALLAVLYVNQPTAYLRALVDALADDILSRQPHCAEYDKDKGGHDGYS